MRGIEKEGCWGWQNETTRHERGVVFIFLKDNKENSKVIDIVRQQDNFLIHKQIEIKNGRLFMRLKKRSIPVHA